MYKQIDSNRWKSRFLIALAIGILAAAGYFYGEVSGTGYAGLAFALAISVGWTLISWFAGDKIVLVSTGAREITERAQNPYVWNLVENLAITAGVPRPRIYLIDDPAPNAFATGRSPEKASIAFTMGIVNLLENEELEGVAAHELAHVKNEDTKLMMLAAVLVGAIVMMGDFFFRFGFGRGRRSNASGWIAIIGIVFLLVSPLIGELIKLAVSRKREYLADASGALLTRYPEGLARALEKIRDHGRPLERASNATAHLWIADPFAKKASLRARLDRFFSTHPPVEDRIAQLRRMGDNQA